MPFLVSIITALLLVQGQIRAAGWSQEPLVDGKPLSIWIEQLKSPEPESRRKAAMAIGKIADKAKAAAPALMVALADSETSVRERAAYSLGQIGPDASAGVPNLIKALGDKEKSVRIMSAFALGRIARCEEQAVPALARLLTDPEERVRLSACTALGRFGARGAAAVPALVAALTDSSPSVRRDSILALAFIGEPSVAPLVAALKDKQRKLDAMRALGRVGEKAKEGVPPLLEIAKDPDDSVRSLAIVALGQIGGVHKDVLPRLLAAAQDDSSVVRIAAVSSFLKFDYPDQAKIVPALIESASNDKVASVRKAALEMLKIVNPEAAKKVTENK